jgi:hypothetical protein
MGEHKRTRRHTSQYLIALPSQLRLGVVVGLALAALYCAYVLVLFAFEGPRPFDAHDVSLGAVLLTYVAGGVFGGLLYGLLHPMARFLVGRAILGVAITTLVFVGIGVATEGLPQVWGRRVWENALLGGCILGAPIGLFWRSFTGK